MNSKVLAQAEKEYSTELFVDASLSSVTITTLDGRCAVVVYANKATKISMLLALKMSRIRSKVVSLDEFKQDPKNVCVVSIPPPYSTFMGSLTISDSLQPNAYCSYATDQVKMTDLELIELCNSLAIPYAMQVSNSRLSPIVNLLDNHEADMQLLIHGFRRSAVTGVISSKMLADEIGNDLYEHLLSTNHTIYPLITW